MTENSELKQLLKRYALTGAAIGLYFGWFFRPVREANYGYALIMALVVAIVMSGLRLWQKQASMKTLPQYFAIAFVKAALALMLLEGRHWAHDMGGKTAVIIFTTILGAVTGLWFAYDQTRQSIKSEET